MNRKQRSDAGNYFNHALKYLYQPWGEEHLGKQLDMLPAIPKHMSCDSVLIPEGRHVQVYTHPEDGWMVMEIPRVLILFDNDGPSEGQPNPTRFALLPNLGIAFTEDPQVEDGITYIQSKGSGETVLIKIPSDGTSPFEHLVYTRELAPDIPYEEVYDTYMNKIKDMNKEQWIAHELDLGLTRLAKIEAIDAAWVAENREQCIEDLRTRLESVWEHYDGDKHSIALQYQYMHNRLLQGIQ